ncbi:MAG: M23 family metallopeptidase [Spirochaetaceae bacterium]|nr:MAG: M23 family metallopeptidase [Spirochaetaceae bacterium]
MKTPVLFLALLLAAQLSMADDVIHVVERGDTIFSIARRYSVTVEALQDTNGISDPSRINVGLRLVIPGSAVRTHRVVRGETYYGIARQYGVSVAELLAANNRSESTTLRVGDALVIPGSAAVHGSGAASAATGRVVVPTTDVAPTVTLNGGSEMWPHPGRRSALEGKFPGIRIEGDRGDTVVAVAAGQVIYSGPHSSFGRVVLVQSPAGFIYVYGGNEELLVDTGDRVQMGTGIGTVGQTSDGSANVYFTVWRNNRFVDPGRAPRG